MIQWLLSRTIKLAQYAQGVGAAGRLDQAVLRQTKRKASNPPIVFDVGANCGQFTQMTLHEFAPAHPSIHAFEPSSAAFAELAKRFSGNKQVVLNNTALGSESAEQTLYYDMPGSELSSLYPRQISHHGLTMSSSERVRVETLDAYCAANNVERIDLLKLDVEGHELEVLRGAAQTFKQKRITAVSFEFGGCNIDSRTYVRDFIHFFESHDMQLARLTAFGGTQPMLRYDESWEQFRTTCFIAHRAADVVENSA